VVNELNNLKLTHGCFSSLALYMACRLTVIMFPEAYSSLMAKERSDTWASMTFRSEEVLTKFCDLSRRSNSLINTERCVLLVGHQERKRLVTVRCAVFTFENMCRSVFTFDAALFFEQKSNFFQKTSPYKFSKRKAYSTNLLFHCVFHDLIVSPWFSYL